MQTNWAGQVVQTVLYYRPILRDWQKAAICFCRQIIGSLDRLAERDETFSARAPSSVNM